MLLPWLFDTCVWRFISPSSLTYIFLTQRQSTALSPNFNMRSLQTLSASATVLAGLAAAVPANNARGFNAPTSDGFPNPNQQQLSAIQDIAGGQLPNGPLPATLAASSLTAFQLIAFNENFEVAFFSSLIDNITAEAPGYTLEDDKAQKEVLEILETVRAVCAPLFLSTSHTAPLLTLSNNKNSKKKSTPLLQQASSRTMAPSRLPLAPTNSPPATLSAP